MIATTDMTKLETPKEIEEQIAQLQKMRDDLIRKEKRTQIRQIVKTMNEFEIEPEEVANEYVRQTRGSSALRVPGIDRPRISAKFRDPETGATWSGRGIAPRWIREAEEAGRSRDEFLIQSDDQPSGKSNKAESGTQTERAIAASPAPQTSKPSNNADSSSEKKAADGKSDMPKAYNL